MVGAARRCDAVEYMGAAQVAAWLRELELPHDYSAAVQQQKVRAPARATC